MSSSRARTHDEEEQNPRTQRRRIEHEVVEPAPGGDRLSLTDLNDNVLVKATSFLHNKDMNSYAMTSQRCITNARYVKLSD